jgi:hypothetical protein
MGTKGGEGLLLLYGNGAFLRWILSVFLLICVGGRRGGGTWVVFRRDLGNKVYLIIVLRDMERMDKFERLVYGSSTTD